MSWYVHSSQVHLVRLGRLVCSSFISPPLMSNAKGPPHHEPFWTNYTWIELTRVHPHTGQVACLAAFFCYLVAFLLARLLACPLGGFFCCVLVCFVLLPVAFLYACLLCSVFASLDICSSTCRSACLSVSILVWPVVSLLVSLLVYLLICPVVESLGILDSLQSLRVIGRIMP